MAHPLEAWERAEALYLAGVPVLAIEAETGIKKSALYAKTHKWERKKPVEKRKEVDYRTKLEQRASADHMAKTQEGQRVLEEVEARQKLREIEEWKVTAPPTQVAVHEELVLDRLTLEKAFASSSMRNQQMVDKAVLTREVEELGHAGIDLLKKHAETTKINKQNVLGGDPVIQINQGSGDEKSLVMMPEGMSEGLPSMDNAVEVDSEE